MFQVKILLVDKEKLIRLIERCHGQVLLKDSSEIWYDLKQENGGMECLDPIIEKGEGVEISLSDPVDCSRFIRYMMEG